MAKDIVTISTVSLRPIWGDKKANLSRISGFAEAAARAGSNIVVFPEMALTGYDVEDGVAPKDSMQHRLAERRGCRCDYRGALRRIEGPLQRSAKRYVRLNTDRRDNYEGCFWMRSQRRGL